MPIRLVEQGETVPQIAAEEGFNDFTVVWNHPDNADLKKLRDPCVLAEGDQLAIPEKKKKVLSLATGQKHRIVIKRPKLSLVVVLQNHSGAPLANVSGTLVCDGVQFDVTGDGDGRVEQEIPISTDFAKLTLAADNGSGGDAADDDDADDGGEDVETAGGDDDGSNTIAMMVGHLDPLDQLSGLRGRLINLGYPVDISTGGGTGDDPGEGADEARGAEPLEESAGSSGDKDEESDEDDAEDDDAEEALRLAVEEFQCDNGLPVTGERDNATKAKLLEIHGS